MDLYGFVCPSVRAKGQKRTKNTQRYNKGYKKKILKDTTKYTQRYNERCTEIHKNIQG